MLLFCSFGLILMQNASPVVVGAGILPEAPRWTVGVNCQQFENQMAMTSIVVSASYLDGMSPARTRLDVDIV